MNDQLYLLGWATVITFATLVVKKLSFYINWDLQVYHRKSPLIKLMATVKMWVAGILPTLVLLYFFGQSSYSSYTFPLEFSILVPLLCLPVTWQLCLYEFNAFFNHWHWDLRISIVVLNILIFFHPAFLPAYLVLLYFSDNQFTTGHGAHSPFSDKELPVFLLICFCVFQFMRLVVSDPLFLPFALSLTTLTVGHYASAAIAKLRLKHFIVNANIHHLITSSFIVGWRLFKDEKSLLKLSRKLAPVSSLLAIMTLLIEAGGSFAIYQSQWLLTWVIIVLSFHIIIYIISGIFFWKWVSSLALLFYFFKNTNALDAFQGSFLIVAYVVLMSVLLYFSKLVFRPGWITIPYAYQFHFWVHTAEGKRLLLPPSFFKPYDLIFAQARFWFLSNTEKRLASNVGSVTDADLFSSFKTLSNAGQLSSFRHTHGQLLYATDKTRKFDQFVKTFVSNKMSGNSHVPKIIQPLRHLFYLRDVKHQLSNEDSVLKLTIELEEYYFSDKEILSNGSTLFHEINFETIDTDNDIR